MAYVVSLLCSSPRIALALASRDYQDLGQDQSAECGSSGSATQGFKLGLLLRNIGALIVSLGAHYTILIIMNPKIV